jgi:hypothetical protein
MAVQSGAMLEQVTNKYCAGANQIVDGVGTWDLGGHLLTCQQWETDRNGVERGTESSCGVPWPVGFTFAAGTAKLC